MDALLQSMLSWPGQAEQLDAVAEILREGDIERGDVADALDVDAGEVHLAAEAHRREQRELMRGVDAVDIEARIGLGIAEALRLFQHRSEAAARRAHLRQDVVAGAVEDAANPQHVIAGEALAQRLEDRDAARDSGLETEKNFF